ncbi:hypothetical protein FRC09_020417 [Ceratobasidium sp. 395]|nr:hypothetical protein FRC09_020417 [Ceratobasidium sp. 395]
MSNSIEPRAEAEPQARTFITEATATLHPIRPGIASKHPTPNAMAPLDLGSKLKLESYLVNGILHQDVEDGYGEDLDVNRDSTSYSDHNFHSNVGERQNPDWSPNLETELELTIAVTAVLCTTILQAMANLHVHAS